MDYEAVAKVLEESTPVNKHLGIILFKLRATQASDE